ncbi:GDP-L-fucose synthase [Paracoccaceae bacterium]|nr:GDP-L-fucose synthase [Paracoccaceae bacterium]
MKLKGKRIFIAGHRGMVGNGFYRRLQEDGCSELIVKSRAELDLLDNLKVLNFFKSEKIDVVINAAAKVGGIVGQQTFPTEFLLENLKIQNNIIEGALSSGVEKLIFLASCCIYPRLCKQPMKEEYLLTGPIEKTNEPYAIAKIAGILLAQSLSKEKRLKSFCPMPINIYGTNDNFHPKYSHVIPGLISRMHKAKINNDPEFEVWGSGNALRDFMHIDDCIDGILYANEHFENGEVINIAPGTELSTRETAEIIKGKLGYKGSLVQNTAIPDGTPRKLADSSIMSSLGWKPKISFEDGIEQAINWYFENMSTARGLNA